MSYLEGFREVTINIGERFFQDLGEHDSKFKNRIKKFGTSAIRQSMFALETFEANKYRAFPTEQSFFPEQQINEISTELTDFVYTVGNTALDNLTRGWNFHDLRDRKPTLKMPDGSKITAVQYLAIEFAPQYSTDIATLYVDGLASSEVAK